MKIAIIICRILVGALFIFSGLAKANDPLGASYKIEEYFLAFGLNSLTPTSLFFAFLLNTLEFATGIAILFSVRIRLSALGALLFMILFTPLTLWLAVTNKVHDCGCFGDAIVLTNWETFWKNVIISVFVLFVFLTRKKLGSPFKPILDWSLGIFFVLLGFGIQFYTYEHLPFDDVLPYSVGTHLPDQMIVPPDAPKDSTVTFLIYKNKKTGAIEKFTMANYPWQDTATWVWQKTENQIVKKGYLPPIHDFSALLTEKIDSVFSEGKDIIQNILQNERYTFLVIASKLEESNISSFEKLTKVLEFSQKKSYSFFVLTSSSLSAIRNFREKTKLFSIFCNTDETTLKTIIRSNPGLLVLKKGTVVAKYHYNDIPEISECEEEFGK